MMDLNRRRVLRGMLGGSAVTVGLPLLNCFLNGNGTALANGQAMPVRFGTWFWGLGIQRSIFNPKQVGANYELPEEIDMLKPIQKHMNLFTDYVAYRDSAPNLCHYTGWVIARSGAAPAQNNDKPGETLDVTVANRIGRTTRFKSLTATATGDVRATTSYNSQTSVNASEYSPVAFYTRLFGPGYQDPNAPTFTPSPRIMARKSVLSGVMGDIGEIQRTAGAEDRARLDQYFTGLRTLERQMEQQLTKPEPIASCKAPDAPKADPMSGIESDVLSQRHRMMTDILVMALTCDQTRVFNMGYTYGAASTTKKGYEKPHHTVTHEEPVDDKLGYQTTASWFTRRAMEEWLYFVQAFNNIKEGDGTLLDNTLIQANTDHGFARVHGLDHMPMFSAGRAGGKVKTGYHISGKNTAPVTELSYTSMRVMGLDLPQWGSKNNTTSNAVSEMLA